MCGQGTHTPPGAFVLGGEGWGNKRQKTQLIRLRHRCEFWRKGRCRARSGGPVAVLSTEPREA